MQKMQLQCFKDSQDFSLLSLLDPSKIEELQLAFQSTSLQFWESFHNFSLLRKLSINLSGKIDEKIVLTENNVETKTWYPGWIAGLCIKHMECLTEINLTTEIGDRETQLYANFFNYIEQTLLPRLKVISVSNFECSSTLKQILTFAVSLSSLTLTLHKGIAMHF